MSTDHVLRIKNTKPTDQVLYIEPLGDRVVLRSDVFYELVGSDDFGTMEIELAQDGYVVHGWVRYVMALHEDGKDLVEWKLPD